MSSSIKIAGIIADAIKVDPNISDFHIREGAPIYCKSPSGLRILYKEAVSKVDIMAFFSFVTEHRKGEAPWQKRMENPRGDFNDTITIDGSTRIRVNGFYFSEKKKLAAAIRCQPVKVKPMEKLGIPEIMKYFVEQRGLVLVTGPTGSGKSTTMASAIEYMNSSAAGRADIARNIITIEDPIEFEFESDNCLITQREVGTGYLTSMNDGVISALRQNPNVICIGEVREKDTISATLRAASSGLLVLASIHTSSARDTVESMLSVFEGEEAKSKAATLANCLVGIISQQLVAKADKSGYVLVTELLTVTPHVRNAIRAMDYSQFPNLMSSSSGAFSSYTLNSELCTFVSENQITKEAAMMATYDVEELRKLLAPLDVT